VWVYKIDKDNGTEPLSLVQTFFNHTASCTAGAWTPDGKLLATVSEDASFYVYDVFGEAAAAGISSSAGTQAVVGLTAQDQRFAVEGGLYSVAVAPSGVFAAVGGAEGHIRIIGLPRLSATSASGPATSKAKDKGRKGAAAPPSAGGSSGTLLASLQAQSDGIETLSFSSPPLTLLAAGSVDGSIALFDTAHRFAVRRHIRGAHGESAVVKVEFVHDERASTQNATPGTTSGRPWLLTSVGMDGVVRRWDARGGTAAAGYGLLKEWRGHMEATENEEGEQSGGILGFVQGADGGRRIVTAGDDGVALVFEE
jgi:ribosome assembly protein SQT1